VGIADQTGVGANFSYYAPSLDLIELISWEAWNASVTRGVPLPTAASVAAALVNATNNTWGVPPELVYNVTAPGMDVLRGTANVVRGTPHGGFVIMLTGSDFGPAWAASEVCVTVTAPGVAFTVRRSGPALCNGWEDVLGEGEVSPNATLRHTHTQYAFIAPPGAYSRAIMLFAARQTFPTAQAYPQLVYSLPTLLPTVRTRGRVSTDGGDSVDVAGFDMPLPPLNNASTHTMEFPYPLPPPSWGRWPQEHLRINFGSATGSSHSSTCVATAYDADGNTPSGFETCQQNAFTSWSSFTPTGYLAANPVVDALDYISFITPPGVGVNKSVTLSLVTAGIVLATSTPILFSYDPPTITRVEPRPLYDDGSMDRYITIHGTNFGRTADIAFYASDEIDVDVTLSNMVCFGAARLVAYGENVVQCQLPTGVPVGFNNVTVTVGRQTGVAPARTAASFLLVCARDMFGHTGEFCAPCPEGATCAGYVSDQRLGTNTTRVITLYSIDTDGTVRQQPYLLNVVDSSVLVNDVEYDIGGIHTYPVPLPTFFNLNGTMSEACPPLVRSVLPGRDICIVGCLPTYACAGSNYCEEGYVSKAPYWRCGDCAARYYRQAGDCVKCPDSPEMLFIGVGMLILAVGGLGYYLNKKNFDIRVTSIGIDFFQVMAVFRDAKISWPPIIKELFHILSAFNLNLEIVAPECLVPDVSFKQKFYVIVALPFAVLIVFTVINLARAACCMCYKRTRSCKSQMTSLAGSVSILLLLLFLMYLYVTKTILAVWECLPASPDDGKRYLQVVFEECGRPGGTQLALIPFAVGGLIGIVFGYPLTVLFVLYRNRAAVMEDLVLRALELQPTKESAAFLIRNLMQRTYYQFKPQFCCWLGVLLTKKFLIAFSALFFSKNSAFQMSLCLLILFVSFGLQVRFRPYMPPAEFADVLKYVHAKSVDSRTWFDLEQKALIAARAGKKKARTQGMVRGRGVADLGNTVMSVLLNFNTVESVLLVAGVLVCLLAVMYQVLQPSDVGYDRSRGQITAWLMVVILASVAYFVFVFIADIMRQAMTRRGAPVTSAARRASVSKGGRRGSTARRASTVGGDEGGTDEPDGAKGGSNRSLGADERSRRRSSVAIGGSRAVFGALGTDGGDTGDFVKARAKRGVELLEDEGFDPNSTGFNSNPLLLSMAARAALTASRAAAGESGARPAGATATASAAGASAAPAAAGSTPAGARPAPPSATGPVAAPPRPPLLPALGMVPGAGRGLPLPAHGAPASLPAPAGLPAPGGMPAPAGLPMHGMMGMPGVAANPLMMAAGRSHRPSMMGMPGGMMPGMPGMMPGMMMPGMMPRGVPGALPALPGAAAGLPALPPKPAAQ